MIYELYYDKCNWGHAKMIIKLYIINSSLTVGYDKLCSLRTTHIFGLDHHKHR